jgi:hypothetical protein
MNYADALNSLKPDCGWSWDKKDYSGITWHESNTSPIPSKEELDAEVSRLNAEHNATQYQRDRAAEYPSIEALVVALWEGVVEERMAAVTALEAIRQQVKARYPKP